MPYYTNVGPRSGPILCCDGYRVIDVLAALYGSDPIGTASSIDGDESEVAIWKLTVRAVEVPGRWIVLGREFRPVRWGDRLPR